MYQNNHPPTNKTKCDKNMFYVSDMTEKNILFNIFFKSRLFTSKLLKSQSGQDEEHIFFALQMSLAHFK